MSWNFLDLFDVVLDVFGLLGSGSKSSKLSNSKPIKKALNHNVISQKKELKDSDIPQKK
jgi:hypothetical protein